MSQSVESFGRDSLVLYLDEVARTPLLSAAEEVELAKTMEAGLEAAYILDPEAHRSEELDENKILMLKKLGELATIDELEWLAEEGRKAKQHFIHANLGLAFSIARKYVWSTMPLLDRVQEGNIGLILSVEKFDYTRGNKFSTHAQWWIHRQIKIGITNQERMIRLPKDVKDEVYNMNIAERSLQVKLGRDPVPEEIATEAAMKPERVVTLKAWSREHLSLDMSVKEGEDTTLGELLPQETILGPDEMLLESDKRERVLKLIDQLPDDERKEIIVERFGLYTGEEKSLREVGRSRGISLGRVQHLGSSALNQLQSMVPDRESFDSAPADIRFQTEGQPKPVRQNKKLLTGDEFDALNNVLLDEFDFEAAGLTETQFAMLKLYGQKRSVPAVQRQFGTKPARTKTILKVCIEAVRKEIDAAMESA